LSKDLEINIDFENHVVLQFRSNQEGREYAFVHIPTVLKDEKG
jgi:hypothetical protein